MISKYRERFNAEFSQEKYEQLQKNISEKAHAPILFRVSESPIFLSKEFKGKLTDAGDSIIKQIKAMSPEELAKAVPPGHKVPNDTPHPHFLAVDFGICQNDKGEIEPQLIELQGFPSLYAFQKELETNYRKVYPFIDELESEMEVDEYYKNLKELMLGDEDPENVILLEIYPEKQKTNIDFYLTKAILGIEPVCLTKVKKDGRNLYYEKDGRKIRIKRIYNRVIFDELDKLEDLNLEIDITEDFDVQWVTHPNWFFKISKYLLPKLKHAYVPNCYFLNEFPQGEKLSDYVLKPLFSFAGTGINLNPTQEVLDAIEDKENYIMQKKVSYAPLFKDINGEYSKAEIRLLYIWKENDENPILLEYLVRMTKVQMVNVNFNKKDAIWIGGSIAFFES